MVEIREEFPRSDEYNEYLENHISCVIKSYNDLIRPNIIDEVDAETLSSIDNAVNSHDRSKYDLEEYVPYLYHFYPSGDIDPDSKEYKDAYDCAWLRHQKLNPHHWQYWVLIRDSGKIEPLDMPVEHVISMLCDWHSFSAKDPSSTASRWYYDNGDKMMLSDNTRSLIDKYIVYLEDPLEV